MLLAIHACTHHASTCNLQPASFLNFYFLRFFLPQERSTTLKEPLIWIGKYLRITYKLYIYILVWKLYICFVFSWQSFTLSETHLLILLWSCYKIASVYMAISHQCITIRAFLKYQWQKKKTTLNSFYIPSGRYLPLIK